MCGRVWVAGSDTFVERATLERTIRSLDGERKNITFRKEQQVIDGFLKHNDENMIDINALGHVLNLKGIAAGWWSGFCVELRVGANLCSEQQESAMDLADRKHIIYFGFQEFAHGQLPRVKSR